ncbi:MAG: hypothetical protein JXA57_15850 [Armatimonadetes bacterium]|nr:hypothetical protein [Armatimonadota bacterium]
MEIRAATNPLINGMPGYEEVDLGDGVLVQRAVEFEVTGIEDIGADMIRGEAQLRDGRFSLTSLAIEGPSLTAAMLRKIPVQDILRRVVVMSAHKTLKDTRGGTFHMAGLGFDQEVAKHGPTPEALRAAAAVYRLAYAIGDNPTQAVAVNLGLAGSTASRWVMKARAAGYLGETHPGKAGA